MTRRILCILLLTVWIFQNHYPYVYYRLQRKDCWENFENLKRNVSRKKLNVISFTEDAKIHWKKKMKEFEFEGRIYDVISISKKTSSIIIRCISDVRETGAMYAYLKSYGNYRKQQLKIKSKKVNIFTESSRQFSMGGLSLITLIHGPVLNYTSLLPEVNAPPPEWLLC